ncbi:alpha/beta hydrolase [Sphingomonas sp. LB-2]|uniref:alpha/beta hydrolase n=1 Tax=Sphingomonas caeni TaxID=2984949 RepID=UPI00222FEE17|nr:alpha/beta hydrolase [Sphingomonas caeni]MCW3848044.1 alpha/beta hydrolase [Sphingomonas caeni]
MRTSLPRRLLLVTLLSVVAVAALLVTWNPLAAFNLIAPKDAGSRIAASGIAYGSESRQRLDVYRPAGAAQGLPTIVFFYGGAWSSGSRGDYEFAARALAARGFVVIVPDYRLVPEIVFPDFLRDCAAAVRWARGHAREFGGDGERLFLIGHSAGAYNAMMLALDGRWLGSERGAIRGVVGIAGPYDFVPFDDQAAIAAFGGWPDAADTQPVNHVGPAPPILLLHGTADDRVRPRNSEALYARLKAAGDPVELKTYPGVSHADIMLALSRPLRERAPTLDDIGRFVARRAMQQHGGIR